MNYTLILIISIFLLYFIFLYKLYLEHETYMIESKIPLVETFDSKHCPNTQSNDSTNNLEVNSSQFIQKEKNLNKQALEGFHKYHGYITWIIEPFLNNYYYSNPPTQKPGSLIWCFATWITWLPSINNCHETLCIPAIFPNIMCDLYILKYEQVKQHFGYMVGSRDEYNRFKRIYTNSANLRSQIMPIYQEGNICEHWRYQTAYEVLTVAVNDDIRYFVDKCLIVNGTEVSSNGRCSVPGNRVVLDRTLYQPPHYGRKKKKRRGCVIS